MTLNQFAVFAAVAKYSSLTKASAELQVSQPSISQLLRQLEESYGAKLYYRLSKGIEITTAGRLFLRQVTPILQLVAKLGSRGMARETRKNKAATLTVGGTFSASAVLLPAVLARLRHQHPNAELEFRTATSENLERSVLNSAVDLAVTDREPVSKELIGETLRREAVVAFVPPNHPLARRKFVRLADVLAEPLIIRGGKGISGTTENNLKRLRNQGLQVSIAMRCAEPAGIKAAVRQKMGVGIVFADTVRAEVESGEFKILKVRGLDFEANSYIVYAKRRAPSPLAQQFLELLREMRLRAEGQVNISFKPKFTFVNPGTANGILEASTAITEPSSMTA
jgi:DNA-binding transcriptional LysR family regulator